MNIDIVNRMYLILWLIKLEFWCQPAKEYRPSMPEVVKALMRVLQKPATDDNNTIVDPVNGSFRSTPSSFINSPSQSYYSIWESCKWLIPHIPFSSSFHMGSLYIKSFSVHGACSSIWLTIKVNLHFCHVVVIQSWENFEAVENIFLDHFMSQVISLYYFYSWYWITF